MKLDEEQAAFQDSVRRVVERHVAPIAAEIDRFPTEFTGNPIEREGKCIGSVIRALDADPPSPRVPAIALAKKRHNRASARSARRHYGH